MIFYLTARNARVAKDAEGLNFFFAVERTAKKNQQAA